MENMLSAGSKLGKYEIDCEIGRGGMSTVFRAYDPKLDRHVAIKVLSPNLANEKESVRRFQREAQSAARLIHPNIVTIHDVGEESGWYFFVMECVSGQTLAALLKERGALPVDEVLEIAKPLASALDYAHDQGIIHRDVNPANVIIGSDGHVTLTDFGIARAAQASRVTPTGTILGTVGYMSPEQGHDSPVDARSDQYSLAVVVYEMLAGQPPFQAQNTPALLFKLIYDPPPPLANFRPDLPPAVGTAIDRALVKDPAARYSTVSAFVAAVEQALTGSSVETAVSALTARTSVQEDTAALNNNAAGVPRSGIGADTGRIPSWAWATLGAIAVLLLVLVFVLIAASDFSLRALGNSATTAANTSGPGEESGELVALDQVPSFTPSATPSASPSPTSTMGTATELAILASAASPSVTPIPATIRPTSTAKATPTPSITPMTPTETAVPSTTATFTAEPSATGIPTPALAPTVRSSSTPSGTLDSMDSSTSTNLDLLKPSPPGTTAFETSHGPTVFEWEYNGSLDAGQGFEVRVWREGEAQAGAHDSVQDNLSGKIVALDHHIYRLEIDISQAPGVRGRAGDYLWTVLVVQVSPQYEESGFEAAPGMLRFEGYGDDGGGGGKKPNL